MTPDRIAPAAAAPSSPKIFFEFRDVCKAFDDRLVLNNVSFKVRQGETCVIMGRSGVGKSVSLKHIMGFLRADSGQVFIDGEDVTNYAEKQFELIRRKVTMVFQSGALFDSLTVAENIAFPMDRQPGLNAEDVAAAAPQLVSRDEKGEARVYKVDADAPVAKCEGVKSPVYAIAFAPDGKMIALGGFDGMVRLHDAATGKLVKEFAPAPVATAAVSK